MLSQDGILAQQLQDDGGATCARRTEHLARVDHAAAQRQVRVAGVRRAAVVVEVDVRELRVWLAQEVVKRPADGGVPRVEDEPELAEVQVAGRAEVRVAQPRQVLDDDAHAEARAGTPRARRTSAAARPSRARRGAPRSPDSRGGPRRSRRRSRPPPRGDAGGRRSACRRSRSRVLPGSRSSPRSVDGEAKAALHGRAAVRARRAGCDLRRGDLRQRRVPCDAVQGGVQLQSVPGVAGKADVRRKLPEGPGRAWRESTQSWPESPPRGHVDGMFDSARY